jgi:phage tail sheath protein FI
MTQYLSPLVDVNEIDLTTTIPAVATSIGVSVLRNTWKGPELKIQLVNDSDELTEVFGTPEDDSYEDLMASIGFLQFGNNLYCTRVLAPSATFAGAYGTILSGSTLTPYVEGSAYQLSDFESEDPDEFGEEDVVFDPGRPENGSEMAFIAQSRGEWGNFVKVAIVGRDTYNEIRKGTDTATIGLSAELYDDIDNEVDKAFNDDNQFIVIVKAAQQEDVNKKLVPYSVVESFLVSTDPKAVDDEGGSQWVENVLNNFSQYIRVATTAAFKNTSMKNKYMVDYTNFGGGVRDQGDSVQDGDIIEAYELYKDPERIDVNIFIDSNKSSTVKQNILSICEFRKDAVGTLDVPKALVVNNRGNEATECRDWRIGTLGNPAPYEDFNENSSYVALYANWLNVFDKWNNKYRWVPSSGHAAGIYANTDDVAEAWFAPAGLNRAILRNVRKLAWNPVQGERDILYKNGMNPIVSFSGQGKVIWGQKNMLDKNSAFNRINVRRLFIILAKAISTALKYFLFEPNDTFSRLQIINLIDPFLRDVVARRGIFDYLIVCDSRNNTPERIDRNELWCDIYIKPTRAAEFIVLNLIATKTGASFTELVAASTP